MELQPKSTLSLARLLKLSVFGGVTYASLASGASMSKAVGAKVVAWSLVATLPGIFDAHLAVSLGYGLAMLWIGGLFLPLCKGSPSALLALAYMLYGVKVVLFQAARDARPDYVEKALAPARAKQPRPASLMARLPFVMSIGLLLSTFSLPLHTASSVAAVGLPSEWSARAWGVLYASGAALFSLLVQTIADVQKFKHKASNGADSPCFGGLWAISRHPNYLGEIGFHCGVLGAALSGSRSVASAWLSLLAPATFISIMFASTRSLEQRQLEAYGGLPEYQAYVRATPRLFVDVAATARATFRWLFPGGWTGESEEPEAASS